MTETEFKTKWRELLARGEALLVEMQPKKFEVGQYATNVKCPGLIFKITNPVPSSDGTIVAAYPNGGHAYVTDINCRPWLPAVGEEVWVDGETRLASSGDTCNIGHKTGEGKIADIAKAGSDFEKLPYRVGGAGDMFWYAIDQIHPIAFAPKQVDPLRGSGRTTARILHTIAEALEHPYTWVTFEDHDAATTTDTWAWEAIATVSKVLSLTIDLRRSGGKVQICSPWSRIKLSAK